MFVLEREIGVVRTVYTELGEISFELQRKRVKNINLRVRADGSVFVSVPYHVAYAKADEFVRDNGRFIFSALEKLEKERAEKGADKVCYLGEELEVAVGVGEKIGGELDGNRLVLTVREDGVEGRAKALDMWRRDECLRLFPVICRKKWEAFRQAGYDIPYPKICYRKMKSRWGSCTAGRGKITLNIMLIEKPSVCIEYVVVHELAHFVAQDHSERFYRVMDRVMPEHKAVRRMLK